jgi:hypothetical protein
LYPPFVSLRQKRAQRADSVPLPLRTVRIPSEEASPFIRLARLRDKGGESRRSHL